MRKLFAIFLALVIITSACVNSKIIRNVGTLPVFLAIIECAGLGFRVKSIRLDYAFAPHGALGDNTHLISLGAQF